MSCSPSSRKNRGWPSDGAGAAIAAAPFVTIDPLAVARDLVAIPSPTGGESEVMGRVATLLEGLGYHVERQSVSAGRVNVYATREPPVVVFSTHLDTVLPVLPVREDDTHLYGRGACDAKGIAAAQISAAERLAATGEHRVGLLFVVGEEGPSDGARAAAALEPKGRYLVNGEPTENRLAVGHPGSLRLMLSARGRAAHSAYPQEGRSAITVMLDALARIRAIALPSDPTLGAATLNIGTIQGGTAANVIPDRCDVEIHVRTTSTGEGLRRAIVDACGSDVSADVTLEAPPVHLARVPGFETTHVAFGTDLPYLGTWGERFLIGPGSIRLAHTDDERLAKADLLEGVACYEQLAWALLALGAG